MTTTKLDSLFPEPSAPPSHLSPTYWPGISPESTQAVQKTLKDNHVKWHIFFNDRGFHNHASHHLLAIWALGASGKVIEAAYQTHVVYQKPAFPSPEPITTQNFNDHLGDETYYQGYLKFFSDVLEQKGAAATLEEHVFSEKANFDPARDAAKKSQPEMLNRLMEGLVHPFIHAGYGAEFGLLGMVAEGLAQASIHVVHSSALTPPSFFEKSESRVAGLTSLFPSLVLNTITSSTKSSAKPTDTHVFTIMAQVLKDPQFHYKNLAEDRTRIYQALMESRGDEIRKYAEQWTFDASDPKTVERKIEELIWMNAVIYGVGGWKEGRKFKADFFSMHLVTSSMFLPSFVAYLTPNSQSLLLRAYFSVSLAVWIARGRPSFDFAGFFSPKSSAKLYPTPPGPTPTPDKDTLPSPSDDDAFTPNAWLPIIQSTLVHPGEHLCKIQRAFAHAARLYGTRPAGQTDFATTELEGADKLDGTLFIRAAGLTADALGWIREGEKPGNWDFSGFTD